MSTKTLAARIVSTDPVDSRLALAIHLHPLDLMPRLEYIHAAQDRCDLDDLGNWQAVEDITRNGTVAA